MMENSPAGAQAAIGVVHGCLVVSVPEDLYDETIARIREDILGKVHSKAVKGVVFDMSSVVAMDTHAFHHLATTGKMACLLGVETVFVGFQPGTVSALVDLEVDATAIRSFRTVEEAFGHLTAGSPSREECGDEEEDEDSNAENDEQEREPDERAPDERER